jgi:hypothetical protein
MGLTISFVVEISYGMGKHMAVISEKNLSIIMALDSLCLGICYLWTAALVKTSFIATIYRSFSSLIAKGFFWTLASLLYAVAVAGTILNFVRCKPLAAAWDMSYPRSSCMSSENYQSYLYGVISTHLWPTLVFN